MPKYFPKDEFDSLNEDQKEYIRRLLLERMKKPKKKTRVENDRK